MPEPDPTDAAPEAHPWRGLVAATALGTVVALWLTRHTWGPRPPGGDDVTAHLVRASFAGDLLADWRLDGWMPTFMLGHRAFLFNGPGLSWLVQLTRALTLGSLSVPGALKVLTIVAFVALVPATWYLARSFGFDPRASSYAAVLALGVDSVYGFGLVGTYVVGLYSQQVAAPLLCVALGGVLRVWDRRGRPRDVIIAAAAIAGLLVTHLISVVALAFLAPLSIAAVTAVRRDGADRRRFLAVGAVVLGALGMAAFWVVPAVAHRDLRGPLATFGVPPIGQELHDILRGQLLFGRPTILLVVAGWIGAIVLAVRGRWLALAPLAAASVYFVLAHVLLHVVGHNDWTLQLGTRGLGYAGLLAVLPAGAVLSVLVERVRDLRGQVVVAVLVLVAVGLVVLAGQERASSRARQLPVATPAFERAARVLAREVPAGGRIAVNRNWPDEITTTGVTEPARWLAWRSGRDVLNPFNPEVSRSGGLGYTAEGPRAGESVDDWVSQLRRLGTSDIVALDPEVRAQLDESDSVQRWWSRDGIAIYSVDGFSPVIGQVRNVELLLAEPGSMRASFRTDRRVVVGLPIAWSPQWHVTVDGRAVTRRGDAGGLLAFEVGPGPHQLRATYRADLWDRLGILLSALAFAGLAGLVWWRRSGAATGTEPEATVS